MGLLLQIICFKSILHRCAQRLGLEQVPEAVNLTLESDSHSSGLLYDSPDRHGELTTVENSEIASEDDPTFPRES